MTCWRRLAEWTEAGVWPRLHEVLLAELCRANALDFSRAVVDGFVLDELRDPATGKRRQKWAGGFRTREEARRARNDARSRRDRGGWKAPTDRRVGEYLTGTWLPSIRAKVAPSTFTSYRQNLGHVADRLGHIRLDAPTLDALYADLEAGGLARSTVRLIHTQIHRALADAVAWELLVRNPSDLVDPPKPARRVLETWTAEQLGHASVRVTLDTYSHVTPGTQRAAVSRVAGLFLDRSLAAC